ncbi:hypothetical protein ACFPVY_02035 [Flavobacterium qiangtangense]|uniref:Helix-turn-helix domain-containing protein n=1 Tax=Flavobacterium qiangtangense TaxID=1442595 RepID=A0ABW1PKF6_9FLAO
MFINEDNGMNPMLFYCYNGKIKVPILLLRISSIFLFTIGLSWRSVLPADSGRYTASVGQCAPPGTCSGQLLLNLQTCCPIINIKAKEENVTRKDLEQLGSFLLGELEKMLKKKESCQGPEVSDAEWLNGKAVRSLLQISPGSLQKLRVSGKLGFSETRGTYFHCRADLERIFNGRG